MAVGKVLDRDVYFKASDSKKVIPLNTFTGIITLIIVHIPEWTNSVTMDLYIVSDKGGLIYKTTGLSKGMIHSIETERVIDKRYPCQMILNTSGAVGGNGGNVHIEIFAKDVE